MKTRCLILAVALLSVGSSAALAQPVNLLAPVQSTPLPPLTPGNSLPMMPEITSASDTSALPPLEAAETAVSGRRYRQAGEALETAETRLLNNGASPNGVLVTPGGQALAQVCLARDAVRRRDRQDGLTAISMAIGAVQEPLPGTVPPIDSTTQPSPPTTIAATVTPPPPPVPMITKALLPGHWQQGRWQYHWVPPETNLSSVETRTFEQGQFVFKSGIDWVWVPSHYVN